MKRHDRLLRTGVALGIFAILFSNIHPRDILRAFGGADPRFLAVAVLLLLPNILLQVLKWDFVMKQGALGTDRRDAALSLFGGFFLGVASPGRTGELARGVFVEGCSSVRIASLTIVDKGFNQVIVVIAGLAALVMLLPWPYAIAPIIAEMAVFIIVFNVHRLEPHLERLLHRFTRSERVDNTLAAFDALSARSVGVMLVYSLLFYGVYTVQFYLMVRAFTDLPVSAAVKTLPVVYLLQLALPVSVGDFGVKEMATVHLLAPFGVSGEFAFGATFANNLLTFLVPSIAGGFIVLFLHRLHGKEDPSSNDHTPRQSGNTRHRAVS